MHAASAAAPAYLLTEDFEGTDSGWSLINNGAGGLNLDNTTNVLEGSESFAARFDTGLPGYGVYIQRASLLDFGTNSVLYVFFVARFMNGPTSDDYSRAFAWIKGGGGTDAHLSTLELHRVNSGAYNLRVWSAFNYSTTTATFALGTTNAIWWKYTQGTGANGRADVWWASAANLSSLTKPADGSSAHAHRDDGTYTYGSDNCGFGAFYSGGMGTEPIFDRFIASTNAIGDNP